MIQNKLHEPARGGTMGTFAGVFTPSILTILGIILFMRTGYVVGQAGLGYTLIILVVANGISVLTSISLAAISTNLKVKGGGVYYLISRTLGLEFGGAIGIVLFLAMSVSIAFYCIGFGDVVAEILPSGIKIRPQIIAALAVLILFVFAWLGADWATKFQFVVMAMLFTAILSFFVGGLLQWDTSTLSQNFSAAEANPGFWVIFAIFFPAVTGFTQGVAMSGDLKDPGTSLPLGTFLAVGLSIVVYFSATILFAGTLSREILIGDYSAMKRIAISGVLVDVGVISATLSSAMASFLGAPRILQSLAADKIVPFLLPFAQGSGPTQNPRRGVLLSAVIAFAAIGLGKLNLIAPVVAMFFLVSYGLLNYATFFEAKAGGPSFRPRFKWYSARASLLGGLMCFGAMLAINWTAGAVAIAFLFAVYQYLKQTAGPARWADSRRSYHLQRIREHLLATADEPEHPRDWRPQMILLADDLQKGKLLMRFASWIEGSSGFVTVARIIEGEGIKPLKHKAEVELEIKKEIKAQNSEAFSLVVTAPTISQGIHVLLQSFGIGPLRANTVLIDWTAEDLFRDSQRPQMNFANHLRHIFRLGCNIVALNIKADGWDRIPSIPPEKRRIDVWWWEDATSQLMLLLAYLITRNQDWEDTKIRVLAVDCDPASQKTVDDLYRTLEEVRIEAEPEVIGKAGHKTVIASSADAALVFIPFRLRGKNTLSPFNEPLDDLLAQIPTAALVLAAEDIDLDAEPEEGTAAETAAVLDVLADFEKLAQKAEQEATEASELADQKFNEMLRASASGKDESEIAQIKAAALNAKENALKAARRAAMAVTKVENAARRAEKLGLSSDDKSETQASDKRPKKG